jgi:hypothetical protein
MCHQGQVRCPDHRPLPPGGGHDLVHRGNDACLFAAFPRTSAWSRPVRIAVIVNPVTCVMEALRSDAYQRPRSGAHIYS